MVGPFWVGDMVMAQSLYKTIKKYNPSCKIDVLAQKALFSLLARMPEVSEAIENPITHGEFALIKRFNLGKSLRQKHYDQAILLPNSWKSALIPFFAKIPLRTGYLGESRWGLLNDVHKLDKKQLYMTVQRFVALASPEVISFPIPKLRIVKAKQDIAIKHFNLKLKKQILALCPGAEYGPAKRWSSAYYAYVAQEKICQGWQVWLFGSKKDVAIAKQINQATQQACCDFTGKTSLAQALDLIALSDIVVTNDSGLMHIVAALNKKIIALYGSSDANFTPPLNKQAKIINLNLACSPCFKRECPLGHTNCLTQIKPNLVLKAIDSL